jgi:O-antigen/teichoic acid export membrane protein
VVPVSRPVNSHVSGVAYREGFSAKRERGQEGSRSSPVNWVVRGGFFAFLLYSTGIGLAFCSQLLIARVVSVDTFGLYTYVFSWMVILAYLCALGFDVALLRFVAAYETERAWPLLAGVIQYAQRRASAASIFVVVVGVCLVLALGMPIERRNTFIIGFGLVPILALLRIRCAVVRGLGGVVASLAPDRIVREGLLIGLVGIAALGWGWAIDAPVVMLATVTGAAVGLASTVLTLRLWRPAALSDVVPQHDASVWRRAAIPLVVIGATDVLMNRIGVILLGWMADIKDAGIYGLVFNITLLVTLPQLAVNTLFAPAISSLYARNDKGMMQVLVARAAACTLCGGAGIACVLYFIAEPLLVWFGPGYEAGLSALHILLVGQTLVTSAGSQLYVMTMTGHERGAAVLLVFSALGNAAVSHFFIVHFGLVGAAVAAAVTLVVWNAAMAVFLWRRLGLLPGIFAFARLPFMPQSGVRWSTQERREND